MPTAKAKPKPKARKGKKGYPKPETWLSLADKRGGGRPPDRLKIEGDWTDAVRKALKKGKPAA
jgi:hypothetical protein